MRFPAKRVQDQQIEIAEQGLRRGRDIAHVREIGGAAEAVAGDLLASMDHGNALEARAEEIEARARRCVKAMQRDTRAGGVAIFRAEGVLEDAFERVCSRRVGKDGDALWQAEAERAEIVKAENMVGVAVGVEHGVHLAKIFAERLRVEVGGRYRSARRGRCTRGGGEGRVRRLRGSSEVQTAPAAAKRGDAHAGARCRGT